MGHHVLLKYKIIQNSTCVKQPILDYLVLGPWVVTGKKCYNLYFVPLYDPPRASKLYLGGLLHLSSYKTKSFYLSAKKATFNIKADTL